MLTERVWDEYYKFCFDRNPWDRALSQYHWAGGESRPGSVAAFVRSGVRGPFSNYDRYSIHGVVAVDRVHRYEEMDRALAEISERLDLSPALALPAFRAKGDVRPDRRPYREALMDEARELIAIVCAREIRLLGYEW